MKKREVGSTITLKSPRSILTAIPNGNRIELVETDDRDEVFIFRKNSRLKEERFIQKYPVSRVRRGNLSVYRSLLLMLIVFFLALYRLPGEALTTYLDTKDAYLKGIAENVTLSFAEGSPDFHAEKFKAHIRAQGKIK